MNEYLVVDASTGADYDQMLLWLWPMASHVSVVKRLDLKVSYELELFLENIETYLTKRENTNAWPGTILIDGTAEVLYYEATHDLLASVIQNTRGFTDFVQPALPEDLALYRLDGSVLLESICHESEVRIRLANEEFESCPPNISRCLQVIESSATDDAPPDQA